MSDLGSQTPNTLSPFSKFRVPPTCSASCAAWERPAGLHGSCQDKLCGSQPPSLPARAGALLPPSRRQATTRMGRGRLGEERGRVVLPGPGKGGTRAGGEGAGWIPRS